MATADAAPGTAAKDILDAADALFFARGFADVSVDEIRDAAKVSLKTLYREFPSKTAIVDAYLARRDVAWRGLLERFVAERSSDPAEQLLAAFDGLDVYLRAPAQVPHCAFQHAYAQVGARSESAQIIRKHKRDLQKRLSTAARAAGLRDPEVLGQQLMLLFEGALITGSMQNDADVGRAARAAAAVLLDAAR